MAPDTSVLTQIPTETPLYLTDFLLPLLVTFITYLCTHFLFIPVLKWQKMRGEMIIFSVQYSNYKAYSYTAKNGKRKFEDRELHNIVEQDLRKLAGRVCTLPNYFSYKFWRLLHLLPSEEKIENIRGDLIGWANSLVEMELKYDSNRDVRIESLKKNLNLPNNYEQMKKIQELEWENARKK